MCPQPCITHMWAVQHMRENECPLHHMFADPSSEQDTHTRHAAASRKPKIDDEEEGEKPDDIEGHIQLKDVTFAYPTQPEFPIFKGFSLDIPAGTTVALVGESGSGK